MLLKDVSVFDNLIWEGRLLQRDGAASEKDLLLPSHRGKTETGNRDWKQRGKTETGNIRNRQAFELINATAAMNTRSINDDEVLLYVHRNRRLIRDGNPGRPPRLSLSS